MFVGVCCVLLRCFGVCCLLIVYCSLLLGVCELFVFVRCVLCVVDRCAVLFVVCGVVVCCCVLLFVVCCVLVVVR